MSVCLKSGFSSAKIIVSPDWQAALAAANPAGPAPTMSKSQCVSMRS